MLKEITLALGLGLAAVVSSAAAQAVTISATEVANSGQTIDHEFTTHGEEFSLFDWDGVFKMSLGLTDLHFKIAVGAVSGNPDELNEIGLNLGSAFTGVTSDRSTRDGYHHINVYFDKLPVGALISISSDFTIDYVTATSVPLPVPGLMLAGALGGLVALHRRRAA